MQQIQVEHVQPEFFHGGVKGAQRVVVAIILHPELGGDEYLAARQAAAFDGGAHGFFVEVGSGGVDVAVARLQRLADGALRIRRRNLENAKADDGHGDAVVQGDLFHVLVSGWFAGGSVGQAAALQCFKEFIGIALSPAT